MIRGAAIAVFTALCGASAAAEMTDAQCLQSLDVAKSFFAFEATQPFVNDDGWCVAREVEFQNEDFLAIVSDEIRWQAVGIERFIESGLPPLGLQVEVKNTYFVPQIDDTVMQYLMRIQSGANGFDTVIDANWDQETRTLILDRFEVGFDETNKVSMSAEIDHIDLTSMSSIQISLGSVLLRELQVTLALDGVFESVVLLPIGNVLLHGSADPARDLAVMKAHVITALGDVPEAIMSENSRGALIEVISQIPRPRGVLDLRLETEAGIGAMRFAPIWLRGMPQTMDDIRPFFDDVSVDAEWVPIDVAQP